MRYMLTFINTSVNTEMLITVHLSLNLYHICSCALLFCISAYYFNMQYSVCATLSTLPVLCRNYKNKNWLQFLVIAKAAILKQQI